MLNLKSLMPLCLLIVVVNLARSQNHSLDIKLDNHQCREIVELPKILNESSGLEVAGLGEFWSFNDSKGKVELYRFNTLGQLMQTLEISNASNTDWEDICQDKEGFIYIGDFGNNDNDRKDLTIYKIHWPGSAGSTQEVKASSIHFSFPEQSDFPPEKDQRFFDVEAMFARGGYLYFLSRDRSKPFVGKTRLYRIPNVPGKYRAEYLEEFSTDENKALGQVTGADISTDERTLAVISKQALWIFRLRDDGPFLAGDYQRMILPDDTRAEGVVFTDPCTIYLTNESKKDKAASLFVVKICR